MGRATQGVRLINLEKRNDQISSVCKVQTEEEEEMISEDGLTDATPADTNPTANEETGKGTQAQPSLFDGLEENDNDN